MAALQQRPVHLAYLRTHPGPRSSSTAADGIQTGRLTRVRYRFHLRVTARLPVELDLTMASSITIRTRSSTTRRLRSASRSPWTERLRRLAANLFSAAYLGSFDPASLCANYLADMGAIPDISGSYSFTVPAWNAYTVVVT